MNSVTYFRVFLLALVLAGCPPTPSRSTGTKVTVTNAMADTLVYVAFGADSIVGPADWVSFCTSPTPRNCFFALPAGKSQPLPTDGRYLNATITFGGEVGCGRTKAEVNVNNPNWYDTLDVSLVDGYSDKIKINVTAPDGTATVLGPPVGETGNERVLGVYPYGCDICVARQNPPCAIPVGTDGCKGGTQYDPDVACQFQGAVKGGGGSVDVVLVGD